MLHFAVFVLLIMGPNFLFLYFVTFPLQSYTVNRFVRLFQAVSLFALRDFFTGHTPPNKANCKTQSETVFKCSGYFTVLLLTFHGSKIALFYFSQ